MTDNAGATNGQVNEIDGEEEQEEVFDFEEHRRAAVEGYRVVRGRYEAFAQTVKAIIGQVLQTANIKVNSVDFRAKDPESFGAKAELPSDTDQREPKYWRPVDEITDLAGVRIIAFFPRDVTSIGECIEKEFDILERTDLSRALLQEDRFGYQSEHYLVRLNDKRAALPEYEPHRDLVAEIQVRTILQHAWAEIEHDIQYKAAITTPNPIRRKFMSLAGLLEIADREFQAIQDEDKEFKQVARTSVEKGVLDAVEITADALRSYLDMKVGPDGRSTDFSYDYTARMLRRLGFSTIEQVDVCIKDLDGDNLSRMLWHTRPGSIVRFDYMLLAGMGSVYVERLTNDENWRGGLRSKLARLQAGGISIGNYDPQAELNGESPE